MSESALVEDTDTLKKVRENLEKINPKDMEKAAESFARGMVGGKQSTNKKT